MPVGQNPYWSKWFPFQDMLKILRDLFIPDEILERVEDISIETLYQNGYRYIFLDLDNTILPYDKRRLTFQKHNWVKSLVTFGFEVYILSNNLSYDRVHRACEELQINGLFFGCKPFPFALQEFVMDHQIDLRHSVLIGDQVFKDVVLAKWFRMYAILVDPLDKKVSFFKTLQRELEMKLVNFLQKR